MKWQLITALSLFTVLLAGCAGEESSTQGVLTKTLVANLSSNDISLMDTAFTSTYQYTHDAEDVPVASVTVEYSIGNFIRSKPLSDFTSLTTLKIGDRVTIPGLPAFTDVTLQGDSLLAERKSTQSEWVTIEGAPLPITGQGAAEWAWDMELHADASMDFFTFTEDSFWYTETTTINELAFDITYALAGDLGINSGRQLTIDGSASGSIVGSGELNMTIDHVEEGNNYTEDTVGSANVNLEVAGAFEAGFIVEGGNAVEASMEASASVDGEASITIDGETMDLSWLLPLEESFGPETEMLQAMEVDDEFADLMKFYGMTLVVGDGLEITVAEDGVELTYDLVAIREETITTVAGEIDAVFLAGSVSMDAAVWNFGPLEFGSWITKDGIPVKSTWEGDLDLPINELLAFAATFDDTLTAPRGFEFSASASTSMELTSLTGNLRSAPWMFIAGPLGFAQST